MIQTVQDPQSRLPPLCPSCAHLDMCKVGINFCCSREIFLLSQFPKVYPAFPVSKSLNDKTYYRPGENRPHNNSHLTETPQIYFFFSFRKKNSLRLVFACIISNKFWSQPNENMLEIAFVRLFHEIQKKDPSRKIKGNFKNFNLMSKILSFRFELKLGVKLW